MLEQYRKDARYTSKILYNLGFSEEEIEEIIYILNRGWEVKKPSGDADDWYLGASNEASCMAKDILVYKWEQKTGKHCSYVDIQPALDLAYLCRVLESLEDCYDEKLVVKLTTQYQSGDEDYYILAQKDKGDKEYDYTLIMPLSHCIQARYTPSEHEMSEIKKIRGELA